MEKNPNKIDGIMVNGKVIPKEIIIKDAKEFFAEYIAKNHLKKVKDLAKKPSSLQTNPFINKYIATFLTGNDSPESIAKALVYPRVLGTSISTIFGSQMQKFMNEVLGSVGSIGTGIDIEYVDHIDGRKKYCQVKSGPTTINKDDITTIKNHFQDLINLGRTNNVALSPFDCTVGVLYGEKQDLSPFYRKIDETYPVFIGQEFWYRLTGDEDFYEDLTDAIGEVALEYDGRKQLKETIDSVTEYIKKLDGFD